MSNIAADAVVDLSAPATAAPEVEPPPTRWFMTPTAIGVVVVLFWIVVAISVGLWAPYDPMEMVSRRLRPPSALHWLGTDGLGRDVLVRTLYGAQQSLPIAALVVFVGAGLGCVLGALAGFVGGIVDAIIMRVVDVTLSLPAILLAMACPRRSVRACRTRRSR